MRRYETIVISDPDLSDEDREAFFAKNKDLISQQGGFLVNFDPWGVQKLAYEIKKKPRGHYLRLDFCGTGPLVAEMERSFRIDDRVLKYMTVLLEENADVESLKAQTAEIKEKEEPAKTASDVPETPSQDEVSAASPEISESEQADEEISKTGDDDKEEEM
jgi:small subunit ribosomal protein S6